MTTDCSSVNLNTQEKNLCSCKLATDTMVKTLETYTANYTAYTDYVTARNLAIQKQNNWKNMTGEYSNWATRKKQLTNEIKNTINWACEGASWDGRFGWCSNDHGGDWEFDHHSKDSWQACSFTHKCKRKTSSVDRILREEGYNAAEPIIPSERQAPQFTSNNNILCCSQLFSNINVQGGAAEFSNINQNCQQQINNALNNPSTTSPPTTSPSEDDITSPNEDDTTPTTLKSNDNTIVFIITIVILCTLMSGLLGVVGFGFSMKK